jgi:hypothetical protein
MGRVYGEAADAIAGLAHAASASALLAGRGRYGGRRCGRQRTSSSGLTWMSCTASTPCD